MEHLLKWFLDKNKLEYLFGNARIIGGLSLAKISEE
jgi:hypothetical protein